MSALAPSAAAAAPTQAAPTTTGRQAVPNDADAREWRKRITNARNDRRRYELRWAECRAFAAGKHHLRVSQDGRRLILPRLPRGRQRYTVDELTQYRMTMLSELSVDDDRPQILFRQDDLPDEDFAEQANDALTYGWEHEWLGDEIMLDLKRTLIDVGTAAVRCRFDPTYGPPRQEQVPHHNGRPILDIGEARALLANGPRPDVTLKPINQGRISWELGRPENLLVPPGIARERDFPWEAWVSVERLDTVKATYGNAAAGLKPDNIADLYQWGPYWDDANPEGVADPLPSRIQDHVFVFTCYERPSGDHPQGRVLVFGSQSLVPLAARGSLDYQAPDGGWRSGIHYFHYIRLSDRFWSKGLVEAGIGPQRQINKLRSQMAEIIDRGMPIVLAAKGSLPKLPEGLPLEILWTDPEKPPPQRDAGVGPGPWMFQQIEALREDLQRAVGIHDASLGENPPNINTYSQLALLHEADAKKIQPIIDALKIGIGHLCEDSIYDIRRYWGAGKQISLAGPDGRLRAFDFDASRIPDFYRAELAEGATKPRSQAAQLQLVSDLLNYSVASGQPLPISWAKQSYDAGKPADMPEQPADAQQTKALYENAMLANGEQPVVDYFDNHQLHIVMHRETQVQARLDNDQATYTRSERHIREHLAAAQANATPAPGGNPLAGAGPSAPAAAAAQLAAASGQTGGPPTPWIAALGGPQYRTALAGPRFARP